MDVRAWSNGKQTFGIRVGAANRRAHFLREWTEIVVEIDGEQQQFQLTQGFWDRCPEFRDSGGAAIREWLSKQGLLDWPKGHPPKCVLESLDGNHFRLRR